MFRFPSSTPSLPTLPNLLPQYPPVLTPEQLQYLQLLNMKQGLSGLGLGQLQHPSFTTVINSKLITTDVTVTESQEYK